MFQEFEEFASVLKGHDNINTVPMKGGSPDRHRFMEALVQKAGIAGEVRLPPPDRCLPMCRLTKSGQIYIEQLGETTRKGYEITGAFKTWTIAQNWDVTRGTRPYKSNKHLLYGRDRKKPR